ncbi:MAG: hypothetical protein L0J58_03940 [Micrococcaceae bacterium]|nr:hypothetical protein [Micrococcaceae bacterium]
MDATTAASSPSGQRDALSIREDFYVEIAQFTEEAGGKWTYLDGDSFSPEDRASFSPKACAGADDDGPRQLLLLLLSGPSKEGPAEIKRIKSVLEDRGLKVTGYIPGTTDGETSSVDAESTTGQYVSYGTNAQRTTVRFGSECSSDPTMLQDLNRSAPHREGSPRP